MSAMLTPKWDVAALRSQFPALHRPFAGHPAVFFDGPAGSQVPQRVIDAMVDYLERHNANHGGMFATSRESDALLDRAHQALADFVGTADAGEIAFGANMTTLTLAVSRALARGWTTGDEVLVSRLDHDANFTPWVLAARDAGATVRYIDVDPSDCTLDLDSFRRQLNGRTRLVAVGAASNAVGTINPLREIADAAHQVGAQVFVDAVHYAPHLLPDVVAWDCDFLVCSTYKFFGPHLGVLWGRRSLLERLPVYKLRPAPEELPGRWMIGTQSHEAIAGALAAVDYLADLGRENGFTGVSRRVALQRAYERIAAYESQLGRQLLAALQRRSGLKVWGITDPARWHLRVPTFSFTHAKHTPLEIAAHLAERGVFVWHGNFYAQPLTEALGLEPDGMVRVGLLHYNTAEEIARFDAALAELDS